MLIRRVLKSLTHCCESVCLCVCLFELRHPILCVDGVLVFLAGQHLITNLQITLVEALCGMNKTINTLDKRVLVVSTIPGKSAQLWMSPKLEVFQGEFAKFTQRGTSTDVSEKRCRARNA